MSRLVDNRYYADIVVRVQQSKTGDAVESPIKDIHNWKTEN